MAKTKEEVAIYFAEWRKRNMERRLLCEAEYRRKRKVIIKAQHDKWMLENPERNRAQKKKWDVANLKARTEAAWRRGQHPTERRIRLERVKQYLKDHPDRVALTRRKAQLKRYGLTLEEWDRIFEAQNKCCAICRADYTSGVKRPHVDHCHDTGKVRGILCSRCNLMLGNARSNPAILAAAIEYLKGETS